MRSLWTQRSVTHDGEYEHVTGAGLAPLPVQRPIPMWFGAASPPAYRRAGRLADGWFPQVPPGPRLDEARTIVEDAARDAGRDPSTLGMEGPRRAGRPTGESAKLVDHVERWRAVGATHLVDQHDERRARHRSTRTSTCSTRPRHASYAGPSIARRCRGGRGSRPRRRGGGISSRQPGFAANSASSIGRPSGSAEQREADRRAGSGSRCSSARARAPVRAPAPTSPRSPACACSRPRPRSSYPRCMRTSRRSSTSGRSWSSTWRRSTVPAATCASGAVDDTRIAADCWPRTSPPAGFRGVERGEQPLGEVARRAGERLGHRVGHRRVAHHVRLHRPSGAGAVARRTRRSAEPVCAAARPWRSTIATWRVASPGVGRDERGERDARRTRPARIRSSPTRAVAQLGERLRRDRADAGLDPRHHRADREEVRLHRDAEGAGLGVAGHDGVRHGRIFVVRGPARNGPFVDSLIP